MSNTSVTDKTLYEVEVAGLPLKLRSSHDQALVEELVKLVDSKVKEALSGSGVSFQNALLLAALHISEEFILLKKSAHSELESLEETTLQILSNLESPSQTQIVLDN